MMAGNRGCTLGLVGRGVLVLEHLLDPHAERRSEAEGQQEGRNVLPSLQSDDRLAGDADPLGKLLLGQFPMVEPEPTNPVLEFFLLLSRHPWALRRIGPGWRWTPA